MNNKNYLIKWFFVILISLGIGGLIFLNLRMHFQRLKLKADLQNLKIYLEALEKQNQNLKARISEGNLNEFIEAITRNDLNLRKEGEQVIAFPIKQSASSSYSR